MSKSRLVLAAAIATFLLLTLLDRFKVIELLLMRTALPLVVAIAEGLAIIGAGFAVRAWRRSALDPALDFVLGYPIFGTLCFLVATLRVATWTMLPLLMIGTLFGALTLARWREAGGTLEFPVSIPIAIVFFCALIAAQAPPASLDELAYHLAIPKTWLLEGHAVALPLLSHSYFPLGIESADVPLLTLLGDDGGTASHFVHLFAAIATAMLIQRRAKNLLVTAAILTTPALAITAGWSLVDFPLLGICVALWLALEAEDDATIAAAIGAGLLTKYTFIPFALIAARRWRAAIPGVLIGSIFFIRNLVIAGNPIAPFLGAGAPHVSNFRAGAYLSDYVFDPRFIDESLGAAMLMLAPLAAGLIPYLVLATGMLLFFLSPSSRLLVPFFAVPAISATIERKWVKWLVAIAITVQTLMVVYLTDRGGTFGLLAGDSEQSFLLKQRPSYASVAWLNTALPEQSRTLVIGSGESFWFSHRVRAGGNFDSERISAYLATPTPEALREKLRREGITHIAIITVTAPPTQVVQKIEERQTLLTPAAQRMLSQLLDRDAASVASNGNATLFTLKP